MSNAAGLLRDLLRKYRLEQPVPADVRSHMRSVKRAVLVDVLRRAGNYNVYFGLLLRIYFRARRMGFIMSLTACAALFWCTLAAGVAGISAGTYAATAFLSEQKTKVHGEVTPDGKNGSEEIVKQTLPGRGKNMNPSEVYKDAQMKPEGKGGADRVKGSDTQKEPVSNTPGNDKSRDEEYEGKAKNIPTL